MKRRDILKFALLSGVFAKCSFIQKTNLEKCDVNGYFGLKELDIPLGGIKKGQSYIFTYELDKMQNVMLESDLFKNIANFLNYNNPEDLNNDISITLVEKIKESCRNCDVLIWDQRYEFSRFFNANSHRFSNYVKLTYQEEMDLINDYLKSDDIKKQKEYYRTKLNEGYSVIYIGYARMRSFTNFVEYLSVDDGGPCNFIGISLSNYFVDDFAKPGLENIPYKILNIKLKKSGIEYYTKVYYNITTGKFENKYSK